MQAEIKAGAATLSFLQVRARLAPGGFHTLRTSRGIFGEEKGSLFQFQ
jgi:hypothetical protein